MMYPTVVPSIARIMADDRIRESRGAAAEILDARWAAAAAHRLPLAVRARLAVARSLIELGERIADADARNLPSAPCVDAVHTA